MLVGVARLQRSLPRPDLLVELSGDERDRVHVQIAPDALVLQTGARRAAPACARRRMRRRPHVLGRARARHPARASTRLPCRARRGCARPGSRPGSVRSGADGVGEPRLDRRTLRAERAAEAAVAADATCVAAARVPRLRGHVPAERAQAALEHDDRASDGSCWSSFTSNRSETASRLRSSSSWHAERRPFVAHVVRAGAATSSSSPRCRRPGSFPRGSRSDWSAVAEVAPSRYSSRSASSSSAMDGGRDRPASRTTTSRPAAASTPAAVPPPAPEPITQTSQSSCEIRGRPLGLEGQRARPGAQRPG